MWLEFSGGVVVGAAVNLSVYSTNTCISEISTLIVDCYEVYHYIADYVVTNNANSLAYGMTYLV